MYTVAPSSCNHSLSQPFKGTIAYLTKRAQLMLQSACYQLICNPHNTSCNLSALPNQAALAGCTCAENHCIQKLDMSVQRCMAQLGCEYCSNSVA